MTQQQIHQKLVNTLDWLITAVLPLVDKSNPVFVIYNDLHDKLKSFNSMDDFFSSNEEIKKIVDELLEKVKTNHEYNSKEGRNKRVIGFHLLADQLVIKLAPRFTARVDHTKTVEQQTATWMNENSNLDISNDSLYVMAGFIANSYV